MDALENVREHISRVVLQGEVNKELGDDGDAFRTKLVNNPHESNSKVSDGSWIRTRSRPALRIQCNRCRPPANDRPSGRRGFCTGRVHRKSSSECLRLTPWRQIANNCAPRGPRWLAGSAVLGPPDARSVAGRTGHVGRESSR